MTDAECWAQVRQQRDQQHKAAGPAQLALWRMTKGRHIAEAVIRRVPGIGLELRYALAGNTDLYVARVADGSVQRKTDMPAAEFDAEWSREAAGSTMPRTSPASQQSGRYRPAAARAFNSRPSVGYEPRESPDGRSLYFVDRRDILVVDNFR